MRTLKNQLTFCLFGGILIIANACTNTHAENKQSPENTPVVSANAESKAETTPKNNSEFQSALDKAKSAGQAAFVVVTGNGVAETEKVILSVQKLSNASRLKKGILHFHYSDRTAAAQDQDVAVKL